ncbi:hypothetical protein PF005_g13238 [Phytophthora fragariae]|uniref:Secreted protein n=1 Tax=Phytophthora fragariae TaxID=53985 RepID=A0A6A3S3P4_9STRA|nr:hypothetical protein PF003_g3858 [Phytophthora fragariae]KAE8936473.1 hypothetical protein PF009_g13605 [Phytophthora fragariae]KAE9003111.1 hypothetical protein PF011_g13035 [Phytophthora fragariae]KAE9102674.1 hypothetical protein PF010_g14023 [Phytophthora fragariae]KAE9108709.1 hypothetical protein PF007_g12548 [Phytophthora fragariae]
MLVAAVVVLLCVGLFGGLVPVDMLPRCNSVSEAASKRRRLMIACFVSAKYSAATGSFGLGCC